MFDYVSFKRGKGFTPVALVLGCESDTGLALIRGLGREGVIVDALSVEEKACGFYSRYARGTYIYPDPNYDPKGFVDFLLGLGKSLRNKREKGLVFPNSDLLVRLLALNYNKLAQYFILPFPEWDTMERCLDKRTQYRHAEMNRVPCPRMFYEHQAGHGNGFDHLTYPVVIKSTHSHKPEFRTTFRAIQANSGPDLKAKLKEVKRCNVPHLIQEVIPGGDDELYTLGSYVSKNGQMKAAFTGRKLRQIPPGFGICRIGESKLNDVIQRYGHTLLKSLGFWGISQVEFKRDARDGKFKLIEINPRSWSWIGLPIQVGINLPYICFCDCLGLDVNVSKMPDIEYLWVRAFDEILMSLKFRDSLPLKELFAKKDGVMEAYFCVNDTKPAIVFSLEYIKQGIRNSFKKLKR